MYLIGLSSYAHESSCALIRDGEVRYLLEEERYNREKHTSKFPANALRECLRLEGISPGDVEHYTFYWKPGLEITGNLQHVARYFPQSLNLLRGTSGGQELGFAARLRKMRAVGRDIAGALGLDRPPQVHFTEHHLAHAASAFFVSPFDESAILTIDGRGEHITTLLARGKGNRIEKIREIAVPHSLGHLYAAITGYLGFRPFHDEWKVMGLSAYGTDALVKDFSRVVHLDASGAFRLNLDYFRFHTHGQRQWLSQRFLDEFGPERRYDDPYTQRDFDMAFALQCLVEKAGVHLANALYRETRLPALCMTGGVVLNCLMNKRIVEESPFECFFFQPVANDAGTSAGSALHFYHQVLGRPRSSVFSSPYLGPEFSAGEIEKALNDAGLRYVKSPDIAADAARLIADGNILGWFQGRMEAGPRALGNRSILADPRNAAMKDRLNARVKKREFFRPFAPSVPEERVAEFFDIPKGQPSPFMILIGEVRPHARELIPAVTHADNTARVQTVSRETNARYWKLLNEFGKLTGVPVVLNTSFNEQEPIVCSPQDAINCFQRTDFDALAIGDFLVLKHGLPKLGH